MVAPNTLTFYRDWRNHPTLYITRFEAVCFEARRSVGLSQAQLSNTRASVGSRCFRMPQGFVISYVPEQS